ncbi:hypothetical protein QWY85_09060 [Neolewinella lacunae]|uniref:Peptide zinc metalloprotease protein n=1 Tax=Neolewinella lacunae TaxID=1517758 RepID=A0A923PM88_9BACT|nr:hypothetical protein [Neolewinella lacunae]MBC6996630.1 hypothetical protein [Neolewinella lacunae]MDN3634806.1 hypothetical protein [Neolewinella lacunae]
MNFDQLELKPTDGEQYLASVDGKYFYIGPLLYEIAVRAKSLRSPVEIVEDLRKDLAVEINVEQVEKALENIKKQINPKGDGDSEPQTRQRSSYIHFKLKLMGGNVLDKITMPLAKLFTPSAAITLSLISLALTAFYYLLVERPTVSLTFNELISAYLILFAVFFIHELGHAAATKYFGMKPHEISFGFYLIFPVFFADVSEAWSLNKYKRIVINLGGVYFQLIINAILISLALAYPTSSVFTTLIYTNVAVILYSLIPFLRYDGYWIYSDLFNIPNLMGKSIVLPYQMWHDYKTGYKEKTNWPLLIYAASNYIFFGVMFFFIGRYVAMSVESVSNTIATSNLSWQEFLGDVEYSFFFRLFVVLFMTSFLGYRLVRYGWKKFIQYI